MNQQQQQQPDDNFKNAHFLAKYSTYYTTVYWFRTYKDKYLYFSFYCINDTVLIILRCIGLEHIKISTFTFLFIA